MGCLCELPTVCAWEHNEYGALRLQMTCWAAASTPGICLQYRMSRAEDALCCIAGLTNDSHSGTAKPRRWGKSRPFMGQVVAVEGLCQLVSSDDKDTIRVEVDLGESGLQYTPGDALGVYPLNCTQVGYHLWPSELFSCSVLQNSLVHVHQSKTFLLLALSGKFAADLAICPVLVQTLFANYPQQGFPCIRNLSPSPNPSLPLDPLIKALCI